jgi:hypothetical protein
MADDPLHALLRDSDGKQFRFTFADGEELFAEVVSASHVDEDDTVWLHRVGAAAGECGWQVALADIRELATPDGRCLHRSLD